MQLNIYVPKAKAEVVAELDRVSRETGVQKNELVLEAIEQYLRQRPRELGRYNLGAVIPWTRGDLYEDRLNRIAPPRDPARRQRPRRRSRS